MTGRMQRITLEDVERLERDTRLEPRARAEQLAAWAEREDLGPDVSAQSMLAIASELLGIAGDRDAQWEMLDRAEAAEGRSAIDLDAYRVEALFARGAPDAARATADDLRRRRMAGPFTCHFMAETFEEYGDLQAAERWLNIGLRLLETIDPEMEEEPAWDILLTGRRRVRESRGRPTDEYDRTAEAISALTQRET